MKISNLLLCVSALLVLSGCNKTQKSSSENNVSATGVEATGATETATVDNDSTADKSQIMEWPYSPEVLVKYEKLYETPLMQMKEVLNRVDDDDFEAADEYYGISDLVMREGEDAGKSLGYQIRDISGDNIPELIVAYQAEGDDKPKYVYDIYTLVDNTPKLVVDGNMKKCVRLHEMEGSFFIIINESYNAARSIVGTYEMEGVELKCNVYFFTYEKEVDGEVTLEYYCSDTELDLGDPNILNTPNLMKISEEAFCTTSDVDECVVDGIVPDKYLSDLK